MIARSVRGRVTTLRFSRFINQPVQSTFLFPQHHDIKMTSTDTSELPVTGSARVRVLNGPTISARGHETVEALPVSTTGTSASAAFARSLFLFMGELLHYLYLETVSLRSCSRADEVFRLHVPPPFQALPAQQRCVYQLIIADTVTSGHMGRSSPTRLISQPEPITELYSFSHEHQIRRTSNHRR